MQQATVNRASTWAVVVVTMVVVYLLGIPLSVLVASAFRGPPDFLPFEAGARWTFANFRDFFLDHALYAQIIPDTLQYSVGSVAVAFGVGLLFAWLFVRHDFPFKRALSILLATPLILPAPALALAWIQQFGPNAGLVNQGLRAVFGLDDGQGPINVFSMGGLIWCQGMAFVPFAYFLLRPAVLAVDRVGEESSYLSGASPLNTLVRITLRQIRPALLAPLLLMLLISLEQVELPYIIGTAAQLNVLGMRLLWEMNNPSGLPNMGAISAASVLLVILSMAGLWAYHRSTRQITHFQVVGAHAQKVGDQRLGWVMRVALCLVVVYVLVGVCLPVLSLILTSFRVIDIGSSAELQKWTPDAYRTLFSQGRVWSAARNSLIVAVGAAAIATAMGMLLSLVSADRTSWAARTLDKISVSAIGIPSLTVAAGAAILYLTLPLGVYGTIWILVLAYSYRIALPTRIAASGLAQIHPSMIEAASLGGAGWWSVRWRICIPMVMPGILSTFMLMMIVGMRELTIPLMLYSPENIVLPVMALQLYQSGQVAESAAANLVLTSMCAAIVALIFSLGRRYSSPSERH